MNLVHLWFPNNIKAFVKTCLISCLPGTNFANLTLEAFFFSKVLVQHLITFCPSPLLNHIGEKCSRKVFSQASNITNLVEDNEV